MNQNRRRPSQKGFALLLVLVIVTFAAVIAILFLLSAQQERAGVYSYVQGSRSRQLADAAVNLVIAQINTATKQGTASTPISWASQPGMIRTYDSSGNLHNAFKLYSWANMVEDSSFNPLDTTTLPELPPSNWNSLTAQYTDMNQPVNGVYPIVDPAAQTQVEDFNIDVDGTTAYYPSATNTAPMPVQWLYILQDGSWVVPTNSVAATATTGGSVTVTGASATNPIVGRIAFWTDDESCKVNVNTASEGAYWDWPKSATQDDMQFAGDPPVRNEFNRVTGHPAMTSLSAVFPEMRNGTFNRWNLSTGGTFTAYAQQLQDIFTTSPRISWTSYGNLAMGGSQGGTYPVATNTGTYPLANTIFTTANGGGSLPLSNILPSASRLYATADDFLFKPTLSGTTTGTRNLNAFANSTYNVTPQQLSQRLFFLTANSSAPETTVYETPRVSLWPLTYPNASSFFHNNNWGAGVSSLTSPGGTLTITGTAGLTTSALAQSPDATTNPPQTLATYNWITPAEQLIASAATMPSGTTGVSQNSLYYFQRKDPDSPQNDWYNTTTKIGIKRNRDLVNYLRTEVHNSMPGAGVSLEGKWDSSPGQVGDSDWIVLNCFDYIRSEINQYTYNPNATGSTVPLYSFAGVANASVTTAMPNTTTVVPLHVSPASGPFTTSTTYFGSNSYVTEGVFPSLKEVAIMFMATNRIEPLVPTRYLVDASGHQITTSGTGTLDGNRIPFPDQWVTTTSTINDTAGTSFNVGANYNTLITAAQNGSGGFTGHSQTTTMQAVMLLSFSQLNPGNPNYYPCFWVKVTPLNGTKFGVVAGNQTTNDIGLVSSSTGNSIQYGMFSVGGTASQLLAPLFYHQSWQPKWFSNSTSSNAAYYTLVSNQINVDPTASSFTFTGGKVRIDIYAPYGAYDSGGNAIARSTNNVDTDPTGDSAQLISTEVVDFSQAQPNGWNNAVLPIPLAPRWNVAQQPLTMTGSITPMATLSSTFPLEGHYRTYVSGVPMPNPFDSNSGTITLAGSIIPNSNATAATNYPTGWQVEIVPSFTDYETTVPFAYNGLASLNGTQTIYYAGTTGTFNPGSLNGTGWLSVSSSFGYNLGLNATTGGTLSYQQVPYLFKVGRANAPVTNLLPGSSMVPSNYTTLSGSWALTVTSTMSPPGSGILLPYFNGGHLWATNIQNRLQQLHARNGGSLDIYGEGASPNIGTQSPVAPDINLCAYSAYSLVTPYDTVISMVVDPTTSSGGDGRVIGKGIYSANGNGTFTAINTVLAGLPSGSSGGYQNVPRQLFTIDSTTPAIHLTTSALYPVAFSTLGAQYQQLGWPGGSPSVGGQGPSHPFFTGYATIPTFDAASKMNYMAIAGSDGPAATGSVMGSVFPPEGFVSVESNATMNISGTSDWTSMPGNSPDGCYLERPDQDYLTLALISTTGTNNLTIPYFYNPKGFQIQSAGTTITTSASYFMPNRQVPSPIILGTLPSDASTGWQTLTFCPNPARNTNGDGKHPGPGTAQTNTAGKAPYSLAPDHLLLDLFWMPVAEPYPESTAFSTAGKVNLNYAMMPFPYIVRKTALDAVLKSVWINALTNSGTGYTTSGNPPVITSISTVGGYKSFFGMAGLNSTLHSRYPIDVATTLKAFDFKFATGDIFRVASQICDMFLYPNDPTKTSAYNGLSTTNNGLVTAPSSATDTASILTWWANNGELTGINGRAAPYNAIYSRITTKSNAFTVHWRVQSLQKAGNANPGTWTDPVAGTGQGGDRIVSELRGSTLIERYLDPNASNIPDYAGTNLGNATPLSYYYKWKVDSETYFQPSQ